jgi:hypothetical protein
MPCPRRCHRYHDASTGKVCSKSLSVKIRPKSSPIILAGHACHHDRVSVLLSFSSRDWTSVGPTGNRSRDVSNDEAPALARDELANRDEVLGELLRRFLPRSLRGC